MTRPPVLAALLWLTACAPSRSNLPLLGDVGDFTLTDQEGTLFHSSSLKGFVWVADFIYTNCPGPCPMMSSRMRRIQDSTGPAVKLVSFTIDPKRDSPAALNAYARRYQAWPGRWLFLTGDVPALQSIERNTFKLGEMDAALNHSTRFILIDGHGHIRAYYGMGGQDNSVARIIADARGLAQELLNDRP